MAYKEKDFQSDFTRWLRENTEKFKLTFSFAYELKITHKKRLPFSRIEPHQISSLKKVKHSYLHHKIPDSYFGFHPFDSIQLYHAPAYLIILFYVPRKSKIPIWLEVDDFIHFQKGKDEKGKPKKSITEEEALTIGKTYGKI